MFDESDVKILFRLFGIVYIMISLVNFILLFSCDHPLGHRATNAINGYDEEEDDEGDRRTKMPMGQELTTKENDDARKCSRATHRVNNENEERR